MLNFISKFFRVKQKEVEAKLLPTNLCTFGGVGEVEIETWSGGIVKLEASLKHSGLPDGAMISVLLSGQQILSFQLSGGYAKKHIQSTEGYNIPDIAVGEIAEMQYNSQVLYRGPFRPD